MSNQFNMLEWSGNIPLCDDLWLGMQARNIAIVDLSIIRGIEEEALEAYMEREKTPSDILVPLSALSQMWVYSLYEFLRTWRQRAKELIGIGDQLFALPEEERAGFLDTEVAKAEEKEGLILVAPRYYAEHVGRLSEPKFLKDLKNYRASTEQLFRSAESLRVTLAKHEVPKSKFVAEAPGYGRMSYEHGGMYWFVTLKGGSQIIVDRRALSDSFLGIDSRPI